MDDLLVILETGHDGLTTALIESFARITEAGFRAAVACLPTHDVLDRLAEEGVRFTDAYATSHVCSPTRASVLTGRYPARLDLTDGNYVELLALGTWAVLLAIQWLRQPNQGLCAARDTGTQAAQGELLVYLDDDEAYDLWHNKIGVPADRIVRLGEFNTMPFLKKIEFMKPGEEGRIQVNIEQIVEILSVLA